MAILNVTPDSFSDGGSHNDPERACAFAAECIAHGAEILDVGGESTRPGAVLVSSDEQIARTQSVLARIARAHPAATLSIDTTRAAVARAALDAGATIVNDVSAGDDDADLWPLVAARGCGYVLMHRARKPSEDSYSDQYAQEPKYAENDDVVEHVCAWLRDRAQAAERAGIARASIAIDPGLGFGKSVAQNFMLMARLQEVVALGYPVVVSASRKSFLKAASGESRPVARDSASIAAALEMARAGVAVVRAHDVAGHHGALRRQAKNAEKTT
ncbi:MAG: dihydropteroate synthase [Phycisphaerales bacterium]|nr:dihydropteroate synthase [Phycisphaerales bacterium]